MRIPIILVLVAGLIALPFPHRLEAMPVPSHPLPAGIAPEPAAGGYYYDSYYYGNPMMALLETALYLGLVVGALILLDEHTDGLTIVIKE
ncbi:MAG: hypothetical protein ABIF71_10640 [Planctomycetota bacterium]